MKPFHLVLAIAIACCGCNETTAADETSTIMPDTTIENSGVRVTFAADASLTVLVKATGYVWSSPAPARPYGILSSTHTPTSITATLVRDAENLNVTIALTDTSDGFTVRI